MQNLRNRTPQLNTKRLDLLEKIWNRTNPEANEDQFISSIMRMTHRALNVSASSLLTLDRSKKALVFRFADGPVGQQLKRLHIDRQSGIAGWIMHNGKPLIVNDAKRNRNFYKQIDDATGFETRSIIGVPLIINGKVTGVIEVLNKQDGNDFDRNDLQIMTEVANATALALEKIRMNANLLNSYKSTVKALVSLADAKETSGGGHSRQVSECALISASDMALSGKDKQTLEYAAMLHDIGKLSIPDSILNKKGSLTDAEWEIIRRHPVIGYELLKDIPFLQEASELILCHHERYDGRGYPRQLTGEQIPLGARLIAVADAFANMTTNHPYRAALSRKEAFAELHRGINTQFCPVAVKAFNAGFVRSRLSGR